MYLAMQTSQPVEEFSDQISVVMCSRSEDGSLQQTAGWGEETTAVCLSCSWDTLFPLGGATEHHGRWLLQQMIFFSHGKMSCFSLFQIFFFLLFSYEETIVQKSESKYVFIQTQKHGKKQLFWHANGRTWVQYSSILMRHFSCFWLKQNFKLNCYSSYVKNVLLVLEYFLGIKCLFKVTCEEIVVPLFLIKHKNKLSRY